jgi:hypothetical protein
MTGGGPRERPRPVGDAVRVDDPDLQPSVVGARVLEDLDPAEEVADVADQNAARTPLYQDVPSIEIFVRKGFARRFSDAVQT